MKNRFAIALIASAAIAGAVYGLVPQDAVAQSVQVQAVGERARAFHVARHGDTLFDLSSIYLNDPLSWPVLWSYNPQITNPHWIYPGDIVFTEAVPQPPPPLDLNITGRFYPLAGFYTSSEIDIVGELRFADTGRRLLALLDEVYVEIEEPGNVRVGDRYAINRVLDRVYDDDDNIVAVKYLVTGAIEIQARHLETELLSAQIVALWDTIERGDVLFLTQPQRLEIGPVTNSVDLEARIIDHLSPVSSFHEQDYVFINKGWEDGVEPGNRFVIWDRQDEGEEIRALRTRRLDYEEDILPLIPWHVAGEAMVIYTSDQFSTAVITEAGNRELRDGMRLTLQRGQ